MATDLHAHPLDTAPRGLNSGWTAALAAHRHARQAAQPAGEATPTGLCPSDWMRSFACSLAWQHPAISAEQAVALAVREYATLLSYEPEQAAALCAMGLAFNGAGASGAAEPPAVSAGTTAPARPAAGPSRH